jgi:hypothetical protein
MKESVLDETKQIEIKESDKINNIPILKSNKHLEIKTIHISDSINEKLATKIKHLISEKLTGNEANNNFDIKISLKPEHLGRISIQVRMNRVSGELEVSIFGKQEALNKISQYDKAISTGIREINSGFSGINYKLAETMKKEKEKKEKEERKNMFKNNKGRKLWM